MVLKPECSLTKGETPGFLWVTPHMTVSGGTKRYPSTFLLFTIPTPHKGSTVLAGLNLCFSDYC